jgi:hypothetical protein
VSRCEAPGGAVHRQQDLMSCLRQYRGEEMHHCLTIPIGRSRTHRTLASSFNWIFRFNRNFSTGLMRFAT